MTSQFDQTQKRQRQVENNDFLTILTKIWNKKLSPNLVFSNAQTVRLEFWCGKMKIKRILKMPEF